MNTLHRYLDGPANAIGFLVIFVIAFMIFLLALGFVIAVVKRDDEAEAAERYYECDEEYRAPAPARRVTTARVGGAEFTEPDGDAVFAADKETGRQGDAEKDIPPAWISPESTADELSFLPAYLASMTPAKVAEIEAARLKGKQLNGHAHDAPVRIQRGEF